MAVLTKYPEPLIFGLDIGTRSIVGTVGYRDQSGFNVVAQYVKYHDTRAMLDGQIHDIGKVSESITYVRQELELQLGRKLNEVCIAAAGRVLKTAVGFGEYEFDEPTVVNQEYIHTLELIGVEKAHDQILEELSIREKYYCVGYTVIKYYLNEFDITNLEGHKAHKIGAKVLATFLPEEVVDGLYAAVEGAGLQVSNLTLEPIAAINVAIPDNYRLLNICLVDVGAGTSDICVTKDGSIIGYGMIPAAGDELTESIVKEYLVDFKTAEKLKMVKTSRKHISYKDIMGITHKLTPKEIYDTTDCVMEQITSSIADKIIELNGGKAVSAVFVVGGGGKIPGFTHKLAKCLKLSDERVALRGEEVLQDVHILIDGTKKDPLIVTPIGICINFYEQRNNFIFVQVNQERIKLYNNDKLTVFDAAIAYGLNNEAIFPKRGTDLNYTVNGKPRIARGIQGEVAIIYLNGEEVGINQAIEANDKIKIIESTVGDAASVTIGHLSEYSNTIQIIVNGTTLLCPKFAMVNGQLQSEYYQIQEQDKVEILNYYTLEQLLTFLDVQPENTIYVNKEQANAETQIYENFTVEWKNDIEYEDLPKEDNNSVTSIQQEELTYIQVSVNGQSVRLNGKSQYVFVDIFDSYPFDLTVVKGTELVTTINGNKAEYFDTLHSGDSIEVYWRE